MQEDVLQGYISKTEDAEKAAAYISTVVNDKGIAILFDYLDDETLTTEASITDNFVETNFSIQDHIAIKPKVYRLRGCVGEIVYKNGSPLLDKLGDNISKNHPLLQKTINILKPIKSVSGIVSNYTQLAQNVVRQIENSVGRYYKMIDNFRNPNPIKGYRQQEVVSILNYILQNRIQVNLKKLKFDYSSVGLTEPYEKLYFIQSVSSHQGNNDFITDIEVTIKEVRLATTKTSALDKSKFAWTTIADIKSVPQEKGIANGQELEKTTIDKVKDTVKGDFEKSILYKPYQTIKNNKVVQKIYNIVKTEMKTREGLTAEDYASGRAREIIKQRRGQK